MVINLSSIERRLKTLEENYGVGREGDIEVSGLAGLIQLASAMLDEDREPVVYTAEGISKAEGLKGLVARGYEEQQKAKA